MWATESSMRGNGASLKKFYTYLNETGLVDGDDLAWLKQKLKDEMPSYLESLRDFDRGYFY